MSNKEAFIDLANKIMEKRDRQTDNFKTGTVITFNFQFNSIGKVYNYAVLKAGNTLWYPTGTEVYGGNKAYNYKELLELFASDQVSDITLMKPSLVFTGDAE